MSADPGRGDPSTFPAILRTVRNALFGWAWDPLARGAWCRRQRRHLRLPGHSAVWVRRDEAPWAAWGERHGYFAVQRMDGLAYLLALGASGA